jgi:hypothetical protein
MAQGEKVAKQKGKTPKSELPDGTVVGNWRVVRFIARGGQGAVWAVKPTTTKRGPQRALKACFSADPKDRARFEREIALLLDCDSPYILSLLDSDARWQSRVDGAPEFAYYVADLLLPKVVAPRADFRLFMQRLAGAA